MTAKKKLKPSVKTNVCAVCEHVDRAKIEEQLGSGASVEGVADFFDVSLHSVARHRSVCFRRIMALPRSAPERVDVHAAFVRVMQRSAMLGAKAESRKDYRTALIAEREYARGAELIHKMTLGVPTSVDVTRDERWIELRDAVLTALQPFPEALGAVLAALTRLAEPTGQSGSAASREPGGLLRRG